ncbi:MAG: VOC family protein [Paenibacillaceae bacterium]
MKLQQVRLMVKDFKKSVIFYRDMLEFTVRWYQEDMEYALFDIGETKIELLSRKAMADVLGEANIPLEAGNSSNFILDFGVDDVDVSYNRLRKKGIEFLTEPFDRKEWGARVAHFRDPDGNIIEIYKMI